MREVKYIVVKIYLMNNNAVIENSINGDLFESKTWLCMY